MVLVGGVDTTDGESSHLISPHDGRACSTWTEGEHAFEMDGMLGGICSGMESYVTNTRACTEVAWINSRVNIVRTVSWTFSDI